MRQWIGVVVCFAVLLSQPALGDVSKPQSVQDTLILMKEAFEDRANVDNVGVDLEQAYLRFQMNGGAMQISLPDRLHERLLDAQDDASRQDILDRFIDFTLSAAKTAEPDRLLDLNHIYPVIRHRGYGQVQLSFSNNNQGEAYFEDEEDEEAYSAPVSSPFVGNLRVFYVEETQQVVQFVTQNHLEQLGIDLTDLHKTAFLNFSEENWPIEITNTKGLYSLQLGGNFETGMMLNQAFWQGVNVGLEQIVAIVITKDLILFADAQNPEALNNLRNLLDPKNNRFPDVISTQLLTWDGSAWREY